MPGTVIKEEVVSLFRRGKKSADEPAGDAPTTPAEGDPSTAEAGSAVAGRERGPWDVEEVPEQGRRVDLGAIWLPGREGMELRMEIEKSTKIVTAAAVALNGSGLQVQVFAAPRSEGIWDDIRAEIAESVTKQGGSVDDLPGPFGRELLARLPVRTSEGRTGHRPARFIGHDGRRWFLRGVLTGKAAVDPVAAAELEAVFADVVVVRGSEPRAPRDLLPLHVPGTRTNDAVVPAAADPLLARGPEITEVR